MKKLLILTILSLAFARAHAQVSFNPKAGINITFMATEAVLEEQGGRVGFNIGADLRFKKKESGFLRNRAYITTASEQYPPQKMLRRKNWSKFLRSTA